jgi:hypothetical protein
MNRKKESNSLIPPVGNGQSAVLINDNKKTIENHLQASAHHTEAAKHHLNAAAFYAEGNLEKAAHSAMLALGHHAIAGEFINDDAKHHAQMLKQTNYGL